MDWQCLDTGNVCAKGHAPADVPAPAAVGQYQCFQIQLGVYNEGAFWLPVRNIATEMSCSVPQWIS